MFVNSLHSLGGSLKHVIVAFIFFVFSVVPVFAQLPLTAFGDLRTAELSPMMQGSFEYTVDNTDLNTNTVVGGGTVTQADAMAVLGTSTTTGSTALFQSKQHGKYRAGLGAEGRFTALFTPCTAGTEQYIGLADEVGSSAAFKNGFMLGCDGATFGFHRFQNDVKFSIPISSWDFPLADVNGPAGFELDIAKLNVYFIEFQYLGGGTINTWIAHPASGNMLKVHVLGYANVNTTPSIHNPNLKHTIWVNNGGTANDIVLKSASYGFFVQGKTVMLLLHRPMHSTGIIEKTGVVSEVAILTIRNRATYVSKTNFIDVILHEVAIGVEASTPNNLASCRLVKNATIGGVPSYSNINTNNSVVELDTSGTSVSGGDEILPFILAGKNADKDDELIEHQLILNPNDTLTVACASSNSATFKAGLIWKDMF